MKKQIATIALLFLVGMTKAQTDTTKFKQLTDSTDYISVRDLVEFSTTLKERLSYKDYVALQPDNVLAYLKTWVWEKKKPKEEKKN